jgi:predicted AlkP superfamily pyrophosphatase or phosphodiesterase
MRSMRRRPFLLLLLLLASCAGEGTPQLRPPKLAPAAGPRRAERVVLISIDGLRPDAIEKAPAPNLLRLMERGASCPKAQTIRPSVTLPSHTSMLSGLAYENHRVTWNNWRAGHFGLPTVFSVAAQAGLPSAMFFAKEKFHFLAHPQAVSHVFGPPAPSKPPPDDDYADPEWVAWKIKSEEAVAKKLPPPPPLRPSAPISPRPWQSRFLAESIARAFTAGWTEHGWPLTFVHFAEPDTAGHRRGWMSLDYLDSVRKADRAVGAILDAIEASGRAATTAVLVTADHGGSGNGHWAFLNPDKPEHVTIPWICAGPGIPAGLRIDRVVKTADTAPTILGLLGLGAPEDLDGRAVGEVLR